MGFFLQKKTIKQKKKMILLWAFPIIIIFQWMIEIAYLNALKNDMIDIEMEQTSQRILHSGHCTLKEKTPTGDIRVSFESTKASTRFYRQGLINVTKYDVLSDFIIVHSDDELTIVVCAARSTTSLQYVENSTAIRTHVRITEENRHYYTRLATSFSDVLHLGSLGVFVYLGILTLYRIVSYCCYRKKVIKTQ